MLLTVKDERLINGFNSINHRLPFKTISGILPASPTKPFPQIAVVQQAVDGISQCAGLPGRDE
jgi:hypothetical protein